VAVTIRRFHAHALRAHPDGRGRRKARPLVPLQEATKLGVLSPKVVYLISAHLVSSVELEMPEVGEYMPPSRLQAAAAEASKA
jgi:hypothetical protein